MKNTLVSFIMSAYNEQELWLRQSIESILNQTYPDIELVLVLDNPKNQQLRSVILEYQKKDRRLVFVENEKNIGLVASLNKALHYTSGSLIARMDSDDICYPDRIEKQLQTLEQTGADFVTSAMDFLQENGRLVIGASDEAFGARAYAEVMKYGNIAHHNTWLLKKEVYDRLKGYREVRYCEDIELVLRALQEDFKIVKSSDHVVQYRLRETSVSRSYTMEQTMKARSIREKYAKGEKISALDPEELNRRFSRYSEKEKRKFECADRVLNDFCLAMAEHQWLHCMKCILQCFFTNGYFRMLFLEYFKSWMVRKKLAGRGE